MNKTNIFVVIIIFTAIFGCNQNSKEQPIKTKEQEKMPHKTVVYQVFTRLFGNTNTTNKPWGTIEENGVGKFNDFTDKSHEIFEAFALYASTAKAESLGEKVEVVFENGSITLDVVADEKIQGDIVKVPDFKAAKDVYSLFGGSRYQTVTLRKV